MAIFSMAKASTSRWFSARTSSTKKLYLLKGANIYRLSGELIGHLNDARGSEKRLDRSTDRLFPGRPNS
jgi:hypothetical protein